jgi:hypothetical protein
MSRLKPCRRTPANGSTNASSAMRCFARNRAIAASTAPMATSPAPRYKRRAKEADAARNWLRDCAAIEKGTVPCDVQCAPMEARSEGKRGAWRHHVPCQLKDTTLVFHVGQLQSRSPSLFLFWLKLQQAMCVPSTASARDSSSSRAKAAWVKLRWAVCALDLADGGTRALGQHGPCVRPGVKCCLPSLRRQSAEAFLMSALALPPSVGTRQS